MIAAPARPCNMHLKLHGKNIVLAPAVVDAVEDVDVALYAPQLLFRLARRVDKLGFIAAEAVNETSPVVLDSRSKTGAYHR